MVLGSCVDLGDRAGVGSNISRPVIRVLFVYLPVVIVPVCGGSKGEIEVGAFLEFGRLGVPILWSGAARMLSP